jgi:hypothetical protein
MDSLGTNIAHPMHTVGTEVYNHMIGLKYTWSKHMSKERVASAAGTAAAPELTRRL